ncbi:hypothetical protein [Gordonia terrae]
MDPEIPTTATQQAYQIPEWLAIAQPIATTLGVLIALAVALWNVAKNREERKDRGKQLAALERAENDRVAAQARKVVPTLVRASIFGPDMWSVKVSNHSNAVITELEVTVMGLDADGDMVEDGCEQANGKIGTTEAFRRVITDAMTGSIDAALSRANPLAGMMGMGGIPGMGTAGAGAMAGRQMSPQISQAVQEALNGQFASEWPTTLTPAQEAVMAFSAAEGVETLSVSITFTDEAGYRWTRSDNSAPRRLNAEDESMPTTDLPG